MRHDGSTAGARELDGIAVDLPQHGRVLAVPAHGERQRRRRPGRRARGPRSRHPPTPPGSRPATAPARAPAVARPRPRPAIARSVSGADRLGFRDAIAPDVEDGAPLAGRARGSRRRRRGRRRRPSPSRRATSLDGGGDVGRPRRSRSVELAHADELADAEQEPDRIVGAVGRPGEQQLAARGDDALDVAARRAARAGWPARPGRPTRAPSPRPTAAPAAAAPAPGRRGRGRRSPTCGGRSAATIVVAAGRSIPCDRHVGRRPVGEHVAAGEGAGDRQRRVVGDLDERAPAAVGDRPHPVDGVAARDAQPRLERPARPSRRRWRTATSSAGRVPAIVGGDVPVERRRAVPRHDRAPRGDVGPPRLPSTPVIPLVVTAARYGARRADVRPAPVVWSPWRPPSSSRSSGSPRPRAGSSGVLDAGAARRARPLARRPRRSPPPGRCRRSSPATTTTSRRGPTTPAPRCCGARASASTAPSTPGGRRSPARASTTSSSPTATCRSPTTSAPLAVAGTVTLVPDRRRDGTNVRRPAASAPTSRRPTARGSFARHLDGGDGDRAAASRCAATPGWRSTSTTPTTWPTRRSSPHLPTWLRTILASRR